MEREGRRVRVWAGVMGVGLRGGGAGRRRKSRFSTLNPEPSTLSSKSYTRKGKGEYAAKVDMLIDEQAESHPPVVKPLDDFLHLQHIPGIQPRRSSRVRVLTFEKPVSTRSPT